MIVGSTAVSGCTDLDACNYDEVATVDDDSCLYNDCAGICGGDVELDECGVCEGDGSSCVPTLLENFESISDWTNTTSSTIDDAWIISSGYSENGAKSTCSGYGYGDIISKSFYFSTEGKLTFWFKRLYVSDYNNLYLLVDGGDAWNATAYEWTQAEVDVLSGSHTISFETRFSGTILLDQLEFTPN